MFGIMIALSLFLPFFTHILLIRLCGLYQKPPSRQKGPIVSFLLGFLILSVLFFTWSSKFKASTLPDILPSAIYLFSLYTLFSYIYFHFFNMSETARRIRILEEIYKRGLLKKDELIHTYTCQEMVSNRLKRLIALGELRLSGGKYLIKHSILLIPAKMALVLRDILFPKTKKPLLLSSLMLFLLLAMIGLTIILDFSCSFNTLLGNYQNEFFALLIGLVSLLSLRFLNKKGGLLNYLLICIPYILSTLKFLFSSDLPIWDSWRQHFCIFKYIGDSMASGYVFPEWFPSAGGIRIGFFHINCFPFLPHRILGYLLYSILPISTIFAYKLQYIMGVIFICFGWWLVLQKITRCQYAAYFGTVMIMMGGTGITFHQEQVLATIYLIPWFILALLKMRENILYIFPAIALFGLGLSTHYPQIQLISMGLIILLMIFYNPVIIKKIWQAPKRFTAIILLSLVFILALLPSYYIFHNIENLATFQRDPGYNFSPQTYTDYLNLNVLQDSSVNLTYYCQYIKPIVEWVDENFTAFLDSASFFVARGALILILIGIFLNLRKSITIVFLLATFIALTFGVNCIIPIPKYLFFIHFPFINAFRQWFHFFPMVNFCLSALAAIGLAYLIQRLRYTPRMILSGLIALILFFQIVDLAIYDRKYLNTYVWDKRPVNIPDYIFSVEDPELILFLPNATFQYRNRFKLYYYCKKAIPTRPFLTTDISSVTGGIDKELEETCKLEQEGKDTVIINAPIQTVQAFIPNASKFYDKYKDFISVKPDGISMDIAASEPSLLVMPLNYDLGLKAYIDGKESKVWRVNSALSSVLVEKGNHRIQFKIISDMYLPIIACQLFLYIFLILFFIFPLSLPSPLWGEG